MDTLQAILLGIIQGLTEFIPISSSGHLVLFQKVLKLDSAESYLAFDIILHLGTLVPVFIVFWKDIFGLLKKPFQKTTYLLIVGTIPAIIAGVFLSDFFDELFSTGKTLGIEFIITGLILLLADTFSNGKKTMSKVSYGDSFAIGVCQAIAILPAISRSGLTITGALLMGLSKETAAKFIFLLSIPAILGAASKTTYDLVAQKATSVNIDILPTVFGFVFAAISGYFAIRFMLQVIRKYKLSIFSYYLFVLGALIMVDQFFFNIFF